MNSDTIKVLLIEDNPGDVRLIREMLSETVEKVSFELQCSNCLAKGIKSVEKTNFDIVILDLILPDSEGFDTFSRIQAKVPHIPIIVLTGFSNEEMAVEALQDGAQDYLVKGQVNSGLLIRAMRYAIERKRTEKELVQALKESHKRQKEVYALLEGTRSVLKYKQFKDSASSIYNICKSLIGAVGGYLSIRTQGRKSRELLFMEHGKVLCTMRANIGGGVGTLRRKSYSGKKTLYENNFSGCIQRSFMPDKDIYVENIIISPLTIKEDIVGLFGFVNKKGGFNENDAKIVEAFGKVFAIALHNDRTLESLENTKERFRSVAQTATGAIITVNSKGKIVFWNSGAESIFGFSAEEINGKPITYIIPKRSHKTHNDGFRDLVVTGKPKVLGQTAEVVGIKKNGSEFQLELSRASWKTKEGKFFTIIANDITKRKQMEEQLRHNAFYDILTGLANRTMFIEVLRRKIDFTRHNKEYLFAVLFIDLDRFKIINDSLGHMSGDQLLIAVAERLKDVIRPGDLLARLGGDEFAILINDIKDAGDAKHIASRVQDSFKYSFKVNDQNICCSASIGIAQSTENYTIPEDFLRDADMAMYRAKALGKARYEMFDSGMYSHTRRLLQMEADLRQAVESDELKVYYQPIVSLKTGSIICAEALVRWCHQKRGFIAPTEFIPIAEETGLIETIGKLILRTACTQGKIWQKSGYSNLKIGINCSASQFHHQNFPKLIQSVIDETKMNACNLAIEITENVAMQDVDFSITALNELHNMGIQISIDDFGTGYSSLCCLQRFPINTLKIDKSFIGCITDNKDALAIISAIIAMSHNLRLKVIAEGVETEEQLEFLRSQQCDEVQGYLFSYPVPAERFTRLLNSGPSFKL